MSGSPTFPIPASLQELESAPYNLLPYPNDFEDDDEAARAESFHKIIRVVEAGNRSLISNGLGLFEVPDGEEDLDAWNDTERIQALYTLVRKSDSLAPATRTRLVKALCDAVHGLSEALANPGAVMAQTQQSNDGEEGGVGGANSFVVSQSFRDAMACHIYMLFTVMFLTESKEKLGKSLNAGTSSSSSGRGGSKSKSKSSKSKGQNTEVEDLAASQHKSRLWRRGVVDEAIVGLPCRIAYQMLESSTGVIARKASSGDAALQMIAATVDSAPFMLHCNGQVLATELLREIGRLDTTEGSNDTGNKASGIKNIAPFISELAAVRPRVVLSNISLLLPHLDSEPYIMRSAIVNSIGHILVREDQTLMENKDDEEGSDEESKDERHVVNMAKTARLYLTFFATEHVTLHPSPGAVMVRRYAMQNNPFMGMLNPEPYREKFCNIPEEILKARDTALEEAKNDESQGERELHEIESAALAAQSPMQKQRKRRRHLRALKFASQALAFTELFENSNASFRTMLMSSNSSDVTEALRFFVRAKHFGLPCAVTGTKKALALMWSNEANIQEEVLRAFIEVFVAEPGTEGKELLPENQIAQNLLDLVREANVSELASIEEALGRLVKKEIIPPDVFSVLWAIASQARGELRASAVLVISMAASADPNIVDSAYRLQNLYDAGLGDHIEENHDWKTARSAACALQRVARAKVDPSSANERLVAIARGDWCDDDNVDDTNAWFCAAEQSINAIFTICPSPEKLLMYTEVLSSSVRRANAAKTVKKQESVSTGATENSESKEDEGDDAIEAELGLAAQAEAETERKVAEISENEIVGRGIISLFTPMLLRVVANENGTYSSPVLMQSATLALCKCMCISKSFCEKHLSLLFSVLAKAPNDDQDLRANIVVALGDLAFRFPNELEPYTPKIYACLRDKSIRVRRHTLMVLTHLILNDMVKVKGQVCEIALCLQDNESTIRDMARLLFHELSKRTNSPIYNLLPDIVSQLSQLDLKQEVFREIMQFLLSFIKKDRQNEMLLEKWCCADLAYCIAQLKVNEKGIKCLNDNFKLYKDALFDEDVLKNFMSFIAKAKKNATKPETKQTLQELEEKFTECAAAGMENVNASKKAARAKKRAAHRVARKKVEWDESEEEENAEASDPEPEDFEEVDEENRPANAQPVKSERSSTTKRRSGRSRSAALTA
ncbi:condensin complex subunit 1 [Skeletonema marinoi]|uniref:Condensin complex subunit 1 n=1 Tax=Skeletonema marinoi TaxID=267567 RepID=A0AAD8YFF1_9STRA|nr:condensin complex subunit 1 [Skeletonema marinoi]